MDVYDLLNKSEDDALRNVIEEIKRNPSSLNKIWGYYEYKGTLLHFSCYWNKPKVVSFLLSQQDVDVTKKFEIYGKHIYDGLTAKQIAEKDGNSDIVALFEQYERKQSKKEPSAEIININKIVDQGKQYKPPQQKPVIPPSPLPIPSTTIELKPNPSNPVPMVVKSSLSPQTTVVELSKPPNVPTLPVSQWDKQQVYQRLKIDPIFSSCADNFLKEDINGSILINLEEKHLKELGMTLGQRMSFPSFVKELTTVSQTTTEKTIQVTSMTPIINPMIQVQATSMSPIIDPMIQDRFVDHKEVDCRSSIAPFVLLPSHEKPMPFSESVQLAYNGKLPISNFETACAYAKNIYENLKGTTLTIDEFMALYLYTCEWKTDNPYSLLNSSLVNPDRTVIQKWSHYLHYFLGGLKKIPKWKGIQDLYRGVSLDLVSKYPQKYKIGAKITWYSCTSTTTIFNSILSFLPKDKPRTIFTINGAFSGRSLTAVSAFPTESEVLLPPASQFEIISIGKLDEVTVVIQMKQIPTLEKALCLE